MAHWLFSVLLIVNAFCMAIGNPIASTSYRFEVYPVDKCPINESDFKEAAIRMNCSQNTRYLCAPDRNLSSLLEFCTDVRRSLYGPDNCVRLEGTGNLNHFNCQEFSSGCPSTAYHDDAIYRYPACLSINGDLNCFVADTNCTERLFNTTTLDMGLNHSKSEDSTSKMETNTSEPHSNTNNIIIFVVCVVVMITVVIGIIGFAFYKRLCKNTGTAKMQTDEKKLNDFLSKEEFIVRHFRFVLVGCRGAGKTTLLKRLQNAKLNDLKNIETTELVDDQVSIFDVLENKNTIKESLIDDFEGKNVSENDATDFLNCAEEQIKLIQLAPRNTPLNEGDKSYQILEENKTNSYTNPFSDKSAKYEFSKIMDAVKEISSDDHLCPRITFLDFSGQNIYYAFQQIYFSPETCYILVVDMTKNFNAPVHESGDQCCSLFESWTYKDYYEFWLKSIDSYSAPDSHVLLVGTHAEQLSKQDCGRFFKEFFALFQNHRFIQRHLLQERVFTIGFPGKGSKLTDLKEIKHCVANIASLIRYSYQIKPVWALFEHIIQKEKRRRIIPRKTVSDYNDELSKEYRLTDDDITKMLFFQNRVGNLLYIDEDMLKETIILDVMWFVDAFKSIIKYSEDITITYRSPFTATGELTDQELTAIWKSNEKGQTHISHKKIILLYMEHFGLAAICDAHDGKLPLYYFPSMNKRKFINQSKDYIKSSILCFQFNTNGQLPFSIFYCLVVKCLKIPEWSILQDNGQNCWYENVACFSYRHCIVVVCLCKFQIQLQVWSPNKNGYIRPELLLEIQRSVEEKLSEKKYSYKIGYKCKNGMLNDEEDNSFIAQTEFPLSDLCCPYCTVENKHNIDNEICWVQPEMSECSSTELQRTFHTACQAGADNDVQYCLLERQTEINLCNNTGKTPLYIACQYGKESTVLLLLGNKADVNLCSKDRVSPLYKASQYGHTSIVQLLLSNSAEIDLCDESRTSPLHMACQQGHQSVVQVLLNNGATTNLRNESGKGPLHIACQQGHAKIVQLLLSNSAEIDLCDKSRTSPLHMACQQGQQSVVQVLLNNSAEINLCNESGASPLHKACQSGHYSIVQLLLQNGADINLRSTTGSSPLCIACKNGHDAIVQLLLKNDAKMDLCSESEQSPLYIACQNGHFTIVQLLLNNGAGISLNSKIGSSLLCIACKNGYDAIVQLLLNKGAKINLCNESGTSPLYIACQYGNDSVVQVLLSNSAVINFINESGTSPLYIACKQGHDSIVQILLSNGADINLCSKSEPSPLYIACNSGNEKIVKLLLNNGANTDLCNESGIGPLHIACEQGHDAIVQLLLHNGADINLCSKS